MIFLSKSECIRCGGTAEGSTFEEASSKINHAVGLSRGINCGASYGHVVEVDAPKKVVVKVETKIETKTEKPKETKRKTIDK